MPRPQPADYPSYYQRYIEMVPAPELMQAFDEQDAALDLFLAQLPEDKAGYAYAAGKWTLRQLLQHVIDTERIMAHRALWFARLHPVPLPGFDEDAFAEVATAANRSLTSLATELKLVRSATRSLFQSMEASDLAKTGIANNQPVTVLALGYIILGHWHHHQQVLLERYL